MAARKSCDKSSSSCNMFHHRNISMGKSFRHIFSSGLVWLRDVFHKKTGKCGNFSQVGDKKNSARAMPERKKIFLQETFLNLTEPLHIKGAPPAKKYFLSGIAQKGGGGPFSPTAFLVNKMSLFLQKCKYYKL